jgi:hypothetical protein
MKFSMTGHKKLDLLIQVTTWAGLTVFNIKLLNTTVFTICYINIDITYNPSSAWYP